MGNFYNKLRNCRYMKSWKLNRTSVYTVVLTLSILIGVVGSIHDSLPITAIGIGVSAITAFFVPEDELIYLVLWLIAPNRVLTIGPISAPTIVMIIGVGKKTLNGKLRISKRFSVLAVILVIIELFSTMFVNLNLIFTAKVVVVLIFICNCRPAIINAAAYEKMIRSCSWGCILSAIFALALNPSTIMESSRFGLSDSGQNVLGIVCAAMAVHLFLLMTNGIGRKTVGLMIGVIVIGLFTGSRSFLLALAIGIGFIVLIDVFKFDIKKIGKLCFFVLIIGAAGWVIISNSEVLMNFAEKMIYRINKLSNQDVSNGRFELWDQYITVFFEHPEYFLFGGLGIGQFQIGFVAHNMIIEQIASVGVVGSLLFIALYLDVYFDIARACGARVVVFSDFVVPLLSLMAASMVSHTLLGVPQTMLLLLSGIALFSNVNKKIGRL